MLQCNIMGQYIGLYTAIVRTVSLLNTLKSRRGIFRYICSIMSYDLNGDVNSSSLCSCYFTVVIHRFYISSVLLN
jgi:hypothetical protein